MPSICKTVIFHSFTACKSKSISSNELNIFNPKVEYAKITQQYCNKSNHTLNGNKINTKLNILQLNKGITFF